MAGDKQPVENFDESSFEAQIDPATEAKQDTIIARNTSVVSTNNSTSSVLGSGAIFTGTGEDVTQYESITISVFTDQASASDGLSLEFSSDNTNWDHTDVHTIVASTSHVTTISPQAQYFRIVYTNGGTGQGAFRMQAMLKC